MQHFSLSYINKNINNNNEGNNLKHQTSRLKPSSNLKNSIEI